MTYPEGTTVQTTITYLHRMSKIVDALPAPREIGCDCKCHKEEVR